MSLCGYHKGRIALPNGCQSMLVWLTGGEWAHGKDLPGIYSLNPCSEGFQRARKKSDGHGVAVQRQPLLFHVERL